MVGTSSGLGGFMSGASIRFSKYKGGTGGTDAWRDALNQKFQKSQDRRPRTTGTKLPKLNSIHSATVVSTQPFGAFVQLGDGTTYKDGLLHVACMGAERFESPEEAGIEQGMSLWVKVSEIKEDDMKYGLDMRYVSQRDGTDLDPYNTKGRLPDNFFNRGKVRQGASAAAVPKAVASPTAAAPAVSSGAGAGAGRWAPVADDEGEGEAGKKRGKKRKAADSDSDDSDDPEEREKVSKKLEKARKKLEKARKKAEKAKKKLDKKAAKKDKKAKKAKEESEDEGAAASSDSGSE